MRHPVPEPVKPLETPCASRTVGKSGGAVPLELARRSSMFLACERAPRSSGEPGWVAHASPSRTARRPARGVTGVTSRSGVAGSGRARRSAASASGASRPTGFALTRSRSAAGAPPPVIRRARSAWPATSGQAPPRGRSRPWATATPPSRSRTCSSSSPRGCPSARRAGRSGSRPTATSRTATGCAVRAASTSSPPATSTCSGAPSTRPSRRPAVRVSWCSTQASQPAHLPGPAVGPHVEHRGARWCRVHRRRRR